MKKTGKTVLTVIIIAGIIILVILKLLANKKEVANKVHKKDPDSRIVVNIDTAAIRPLVVAKEYLGSFEAKREVTISAETQGRVIADHIQDGDLVHGGTLIAQIDHTSLLAQRVAAQGTYQNAKTNLQRYKNASIGEGVSQMQVDEQLLTLKNAQSQLQQIDKQIAQSNIVAPFMGNVNAKSFELGSFVSPGTKLLEIADISLVKLSINVPEAEVGFFSKDKTIKIHTDVFPDIEFSGEVDELVTKADASHNYPVKISVVNNNQHKLLPGMYGKVSNNNELNKDALTIRRAALLGSAVNPQVFVVKNGIVHLVNIQTGRSNEKLIEVSRGITAGDIVVTSGQVNLSDGIKVLPKK